MATTLNNYRDLGTGGADLSTGFQYEFFCAGCDSTWRSPFVPYRTGQVAGVLARVLSFFDRSGVAERLAGGVADIADFRARGARDKAFAQALRGAQGLYAACPACHRQLCADCFDTAQPACHACQRERRDHG